MPRLSFLLRISLVALLCAAWQSALLHPLQHVDANGVFVHVPGSHVPKAPGEKGGTSPSCDAIAAVAACVSGAAPLAVAALPVADLVYLRDAAAPTRAPTPAYRSQAPPTLL